MVDSALNTYSPLEDAPRMVGPSVLKTRPICGKINLRGEGDDFIQGCGKTLRLDLPLSPNTVAQNDDMTIFWLGPNEWLLHCNLNRTAALIEKLKQQLSTVHHAVTEVSDYYVVVRLSGPNSSEILVRGTPLDLHPSKFKPGACAQTRFGHASILLHSLEPESYDIQVRWSYARYLWDYLTRVAEQLMGV